MDPDHLSRERIMNPNHGNCQAPTKQHILDIFEFCTEIYRTTPIMGATKLESGMHNRGVKEALITLVTTFRCLGSRASLLSMPPQWDTE
eukprot:11048254-Heterocapsa_arctica.AAC.1